MRALSALALALFTAVAACRDTAGPTPVVATVAVAESTVALLGGDTLRLTVTVLDSAGTRLSVRGVAWASSDSVIATVSGAGLLTARAPGSAWVFAASGAEADSVAVIVADGLQVKQLVAGARTTCAIRLDDSAVCWGNNGYGQLGAGLPGGQSSRPIPVGGGHAWASLTAGGWHTCGLTLAGTAYCWGDNMLGQLGDSTFQQWRLLPAEVRVISGPSGIAAGTGFSCGFQAGYLHCWGQLSLYWFEDVAGLSTGAAHACYRSASGQMACWGNGFYGQLGDGAASFSGSPVPVSGGIEFASFATGDYFTCGLTAAGAAYCWGQNSSGQLGDGTTIQRNTPVAVTGGHAFAGISAGGGHACGVTGSGSVYCWGYNGDGRLGDGTTGDRHVPTRVSARRSFSTISAGGSHTCGVTADRYAFCWGDNLSGQVGDNTMTQRTTPVPVWRQ